MRLVEPGAAGPGRLLRAKGCPDCKGTGYKGRIAVYEGLLVDDEARAILKKYLATGDTEGLIWLRRASGK
jgi:type II secretory ATPase GspE/PulE/Tfp pilus assembly ATPase PilB-like protein